MKIPYYHVDSFTDELFGGNPAGVCILADRLSDKAMQQIAAENRHSQTAFVGLRDDDEFDLRWFTPKVEDDLCGHATLASAYVLWQRKHQRWPVRFHTRSGVLTVARNRDEFEMEFPNWTPQPCDIPAELLPALGIEAGHVMKSRDYLVVVDDPQQVCTLKPDISALAKLDIGIGGTIITAAGQGDCDYVCRFFAPSVGIDEDPATGSIQCTLAPYWSAQLGKTELRMRQLSARGGSARCRVTDDRVRIAGQARLYLEGSILL
jgi:PhzF family phenazine biosynthesis protein